MGKFIRTKKEALEECVKMWKWIAANPKQFDPIWEHQTCVMEKVDYANEYNKDWIYNCSCCQYSFLVSDKFEENSCRDCPIKPEFWLDTYKLSDSEVDDGYYCEHPASPYRKWSKSKSVEDRAMYASQVLELAKKALKEATW